MMMRVILALSLGLCGSAPAQVESDAPQTVGEASGFARTGTSADVEAFLREIDGASDRTWLSSIGRSHEGKELPLLVIADPPVRSPEEARESKKLVVLLFGNIHSGETCGKEALQMLARELALGERSDLLDDLVVCLVPNYNPDSNDKMAPDNRRGQNGPEEMGLRHNAQDLDLNRDWIKMEAPETRALVRFMNRWDPAVIVDTHTTNGSNHRYTITYQGPKHPAGDPGLIGFVRDTFLPAVDARFEDQSDYKAFFYGNFDGEHTKWTTYPAWPRYGAAYRGLRNQIAVLSEAYAYATFEDRVLGTLEFCRAVLEEAAEHKDAIRKTIRAAEAFNRSSESREVALRERPVPFEEKVTVLGYQEYDEQSNRVEASDEERDYKVELINDFQATLSVDRPWAYLIPREHQSIATHLQRHGIEVLEVREEMELDGEVYRIDEMAHAEREFQGHRALNISRVTPITRGVRVAPGWYLVRTEQDLGQLASYMLEPQATDSLASWNFLDEALEAGGEYPIVRVVEESAILTRQARALAEDRETPKRLTFEMLYEGRNRPDLDGSAASGLAWVDDEHYRQRKGGEQLVVHARTGRVREAEITTDDFADRIAAFPAIDRDEAGKIARRSFANPGELGGVFSHDGDLYFVSGDATHGVRLTSSPAVEEAAQLSPDGKSVAFVLDNNLWIVDVETQAARALTTGGTDTLRKGKASWLYYEELFGRNWRAFWWSPDSRNLAFLETDSSAVPRYTIVDNQRRKQRVEVERYARPGERNPHVEMGVVSREGGAVRQVDLSAYDDGLYLVSHVSWTPDGSNAIVHVQNRIQTWVDILQVPARGGTPTKLMRDATEAWIDSPGAFRYLEDESFLMSSERDGFQHWYRYDKDGSLMGQVTEGAFEARSIEHIDEDGGWLYFTGTVDSSIANNLYKARLDGSERTRLTNEPGSHAVTMSPDGSMFIDAWSAINETPRVALRSSADGALIRWIDTNPVYELDDYQLAIIEHMKIPTRREGVELEGILHLPADFDASREYPIWVMTYAGPHSPTVRDSFQGGRTWEQLLCSAGIVVLRTDPYPASGKGAQSAWESYLNMGVRELEDLEDAVSWVLENEWADASRVGISGHSFGGYITSYALTHSELFSAGIAGAPVTDWRDYDTIYTERYMSTPQENPEGYERTSVVEGAKDLHGRLLIAHGTIDDNVHLHNSIRLISALQRANKLFETAIYPGSRHGIRSGQYRRYQWDFIKRTMGVDGSGYEGDSTGEPVESEADRVIDARSRGPAQR